MSEKRLPPHITEDDMRRISEVIVPTIVAETRRVTLREVLRQFDTHPLVAERAIVAVMLEEAS
jgi:hypothetical protein